MIVLDTHVLIWYIADPDRLSEKARKTIEKAVNKKEIYVSSISIWEIYMLVMKDRLKLTMDVDSWVAKIEELPFINFIPIDNGIAAKSVTLPEPFHQDPADRMIVATALREGAVIITSDKSILNYSYIRSLW